MCDMMMFPDSAEEFMEQYKIVDTEQVYTNGAELIPIFRMKQWLEHLQDIEPERKKGRWMQISPAGIYECSECGQTVMTGDIGCYKYCHGCGAYMKNEKEELNMKSNIISAFIFASDLKKSAIKRIMKDLGYEGCDPARFGLDGPDTIVAMITYHEEEEK